MCSITNKKVHWILYILILYGKVISGESLALNSVLKDLCSRSLANLIFQICTGDIPVQDLPSSSLSRRSKRAALFYATERHKRQIVDECCLHPCTVAQLVEYCPENW
ncbi:bombyxin B-10-like [Aricia agestis]|uniref:bombyxin B-10-like n=1 Tax=Aricia agestis TaxID=91739 RepID=UPI001C2037EB|nr:bombyxin B-10-like [Aricia agestis]